MDAIEEAYWLSRFFSRALASGRNTRFPPVSRFQRLFSIFYTISQVVERLLVTRT